MVENYKCSFLLCINVKIFESRIKILTVLYDKEWSSWTDKLGRMLVKNCLQKLMYVVKIFTAQIKIPEEVFHKQYFCEHHVTRLSFVHLQNPQLCWNRHPTPKYLFLCILLLLLSHWKYTKSLCKINTCTTLNSP